MTAPQAGEWNQLINQLHDDLLAALTEPAGTVKAYAGVAAPTGYLLCYGQAVSRTTYAGLFAAIGATFGAGDGSTTFNLPDLRGRTVAGVDNMGGAAASRLTGATGGVAGTLGAVGGAEAHVLTAAQMPQHTHSATYDASAGSSSVGNRVMTTSAGNGVGTWTSSTAGGNGAHNNVQPTMVLNWIIKL